MFPFAVAGVVSCIVIATITYGLTTIIQLERNLKKEQEENLKTNEHRKEGTALL